MVHHGETVSLRRKPDLGWQAKKKSLCGKVCAMLGKRCNGRGMLQSTDVFHLQGTGSFHRKASEGHSLESRGGAYSTCDRLCPRAWWQFPMRLEGQSCRDGGALFWMLESAAVRTF